VGIHSLQVTLCTTAWEVGHRFCIPINIHVHLSTPFLPIPRSRNAWSAGSCGWSNLAGERAEKLQVYWFIGKLSFLNIEQALWCTGQAHIKPMALTLTVMSRPAPKKNQISRFFFTIWMLTFSSKIKRKTSVTN